MLIDMTWNSDQGNWEEHYRVPYYLQVGPVYTDPDTQEEVTLEGYWPAMRELVHALGWVRTLAREPYPSRDLLKIPGLLLMEPESTLARDYLDRQLRDQTSDERGYWMYLDSLTREEAERFFREEKAKEQATISAFHEDLAAIIYRQMDDKDFNNFCVDTWVLTRLN